MLHACKKSAPQSKKEEPLLSLCRRTEKFRLTYTLHQEREPKDPCHRLFSLSIVCASPFGTTEANLPDFTDDLKEGETFLFRLARNEVFPEHLLDVWEDLLTP